MVIATFNAECPRCHREISQGNGNPEQGPLRRPDDVVKWHGQWIHALCAPGGDDEC